MSFYAIHFRSLYSSARIFLPAGNGLMEKVLKRSEIPSEPFTLFFTSEVYVGFLWPYASDRTINIKKLQVTQGPNCQLKLS